MNARVEKVKPHEYEILNELAQDSLATQANLSARLGIAVGSVNWYIKRLIQRGWLKVSHLDRTRLQYDLTPEGMKVFTKRAMSYARDSLKVYAGLRAKARQTAQALTAQNVTQVYIQGEDELADILRLTCMEAGLRLLASPNGVTLAADGQGYKIIYHKENQNA
ncbi:MAG: hypothetical protein Fur002_23330 [Anaerolineales bacterium]